MCTCAPGWVGSRCEIPSVVRSFNSCGNRGYAGPTIEQCANVYDDWINDELSVVDGIQIWTIPTSGLYKISAVGATGSDTYHGWRGGCNIWTFCIIPGTIITI